jgi:HK97 family phage prohead protease
MSAGDNDVVRRFVPLRESRVDVSADAQRLKGYAIVFNSLSQDLGGFREQIAPSAVDRTLRAGTNVDALIDHRRETSAIIGSTDSGLLRLRKDRHGLGVEITPPDTSTARDLLETVKKGLVKGMSFAFRVMPDGQEWDDQAEGGLIRTITDMVFSEVSIVVNPAYLETEISARIAAADVRALQAYRAQIVPLARRLRELQLRARGI